MKWKKEYAKVDRGDETDTSRTSEDEDKDKNKEDHLSSFTRLVCEGEDRPNLSGRGNYGRLGMGTAEGVYWIDMLHK